MLDPHMKEDSNLVTLYSKNDCQQCVATKRKLTANNIPYREFNVDESEQAADVARGFGYLQAPVVVPDFTLAEKAGMAHWSGFRPDLLDKMKV